MENLRKSKPVTLTDETVSIRDIQQYAGYMDMYWQRMKETYTCIGENVIQKVISEGKKRGILQKSAAKKKSTSPAK